MGTAFIYSKSGATEPTVSKGVVFDGSGWGIYGAIIESPNDSQAQAVASVTQTGNTVTLSSKSVGAYVRMANFLINNGNVVDLSEYSKLIFTMNTENITGTYNELRVATSTALPANDGTACTILASYKEVATGSTTYTVDLPAINGLYFMFKLQGYYTQNAAKAIFTDIHFE